MVLLLLGVGDHVGRGKYGFSVLDMGFGAPYKGLLGARGSFWVQLRTCTWQAEFWKGGGL
jgi:hypothetical protein